MEESMGKGGQRTQVLRSSSLSIGVIVMAEGTCVRHVQSVLPPLAPR
jgi:hypothetical protein